MMSDWDKIVNELCREARDFRDWAIGYGEDEAEKEARRRLDRFWEDQPWYIKPFRKTIMRYVYYIYKSLT